MRKPSNGRIRELFKDFLSAHNLKEEDVLNAIKEKRQSEDVPLCVLKSKRLGILESVVKYYREIGFSYDKIATMLNRNRGSIVCSYNAAVKKYSKRFAVEDCPVLIPYSIFKDRKYGVLEALSMYMKDMLKMNYSEIARALDRNPRTIWTAYNRARKK